MFVLGPTDNGNTTDRGAESKSKRKTVDSRFDTKQGSFGGNRAHSSTPRFEGDYTRPTLGAPIRKQNPVDTVERDIDDPAGTIGAGYYGDSWFTRQRNNSVLSFKKNLIHIYTSPDHRPLENTDAFEPDPTDPDFLVKKPRSKVKGHYGDGQYDNYPNRGYEGELR